ncbi:MAG: DUF6054 family protein [Clostridium sp.]|uniref:DUF6054 family protein n=1 Tax=Clostridium sp. TaxID=1506 RepID=UPI003EE5CD23
MKADNFTVNLNLKETIEILDSEIVGRSFTGERIDYHVVYGDANNKAVVILIYEKHYWRAGNRLTLTVTIDNMENFTKIHSVGAGGGEGFFKFDWGAGDDFTSAPRYALKKYIIN